MRSITSRAVSGLTVLMVALVTILGLSSTTNAHASAEPATAHTASGLPKVLKVGTEGVYPPFSYHKGSELTGFDVDYMRALGNKLGVQIQFVEVPWDSMFAALSSGRIDLVANQVTLNPQRQQLYDLSNPYIETTGVVVVNDSNNSIHSLKDIRGKRAAENITSNWAEVAKAAGAQIVTVDGMDKAIQNLRQGSVDVMVNDQLAVKNYIAGSSNPGIKIVAQTSDKSQSVFAARKNTGYMTQINQGIADLRSDGTYQKLYDKYFTGGSTIPSDWELVKQNAWPMAWAAIKVTIPLTIISFALALIIALGVAIARMSANPFASGPARLFISLMRGIPVLVLLMLIYFGLPQFGWKIAPFAAAVAGLALNTSGYAAEIIRSAIISVPRGQWEAARTIGMNYRTSLRRVVLPQAARIAIPPLSNTAIDLMKSTSLASAVLVTEMFRQAQIAAAPTFQFFTLYGLAALYYWVIVVALTWVQGRIEKRVSRFVA